VSGESGSSDNFVLTKTCYKRYSRQASAAVMCWTEVICSYFNECQLFYIHHRVSFSRVAWHSRL